MEYPNNGILFGTKKNKALIIMIYIKFKNIMLSENMSDSTIQNVYNC